MSTQLDIELYTLAIEGLKARVDNATDQIALYQSALETLTGAPRRGRQRKVRLEVIGESTPAPMVARKRHKMSAESRKRIAEAQKKRWAKYRKEQKANAKTAA